MTGLQVQETPAPPQLHSSPVQARPVDGRRSLLEALEFLAERGVSREVICLAMVRSGISLEVARVLSQCVVTSRPQLAAPAPVQDVLHSSRAASLALRKLSGVIVTVVLYLGLGLSFGFMLGMEMGLAQGVEQGLDRVLRLVLM